MIPAIDRVFVDRDLLRNKCKLIDNKNAALNEQNRALAAQNKMFDDRNQTLTEQNNILDEKTRALELEVKDLREKLSDLKEAPRADPPQRYFENWERYIVSGGSMDPHRELGGFVANSQSNRRDMARFYAFYLIFDQITKENLSGEIAELGVYRGHTARLLASLARQGNRTLYLMDTFNGFSSDDLVGVDSGRQIEFADANLREVCSMVGEENVRYIKGHFPDSAKRLPAHGVFCLVHIDCDLYAPIRAGLEYFYPRLVEGGFLVIHDYSSLYWPGAEQAVDEFLRDKREALVPIPDISGTVIVRKSKTKN
jgi:O-methyltransferase